MKKFEMKFNLLPALGLLAAMGISTAQAADGDAFKGESHYAVCAGCHGADGMGLEATNAPRLQGQFDWYLIRQLQNYQSGARGVNKDDTFGTTMRAMAGTLPNEQAIKDVVAYIGTLEEK